MIKDRNKGISNISYNHLNLPTQIEFEGTNDKITYLYPDAFGTVGQKLKKTVVYSDSIKIVDYLDGFQYAGGELNFFPHPEGYVSVKRGGRTAPDGSQGYVFNYVFNYTDHLDERNQSIALIEVCERSSVRVSYSKDPQTHQLKILEENHYYPFGLKHSVYSAGRLRDFEVDFSNPEGEHVFLNNVTKTDYQYKYNGQEWQDELGLNMYAMDMRQYDPAIARWVAQDPVTHFEYSPYNAFDNNPVFWADPSGADAVDIGYDRTINSQDMMGSYHWSGGFQEIENEGGEGMEIQKANSSSSEQRSSYDNGDPKKKDQQEGSSSGGDLVTTTSTTRMENNVMVDIPGVAKVYTATDKTVGNAGTLNIDKSVNVSDGSATLSGQLNTLVWQGSLSAGSNGMGASSNLSISGNGAGTTIDSSGATFSGFSNGGNGISNSFNVQVKPGGMAIGLAVTLGVIFAPQVTIPAVLSGL